MAELIDSSGEVKGAIAHIIKDQEEPVSKAQIIRMIVISKANLMNYYKPKALEHRREVGGSSTPHA